MDRISLLILLCCPIAVIAAQIPGGGDSASVVILSDRVGPVIDSQEREQFRLFPGIQRFERAVVLQLPDTTFVVRFTMSEPDGRERDTMVVYGGPLLRNMAERIEHFEEIVEGTYRISDKPAQLKLTTGAAAVYSTIYPAAPLRPAPPSGRLPLAASGGMRPSRNYPLLLDCGVGLRTFNPDLNGLSEAFGSTPTFSFSPMVTGIIEIAVIEILSVMVEAGISPNDEGFAADAGIVFYVPLPANRDLRPFAGVAMSWCSVGGSYSGLNMTGGARGFTFTIGLEYVAKGVLAFDLFGGYSSFPTVSTTFADYSPPRSISATLDFSGAAFGLRLKFLQ